MKTALEILEEDESGVYTPHDIVHMMIKFAKMHVQAALQQASEQAKAKENPEDYGTGEIWVDKPSILNAYPLDNIK